MHPKEKILVTAFDFYPNTGGVSTYAWEVAESLGRQGHSVTVIARDRPAPPPHPKHFKIHWIPLSESGLGSVLSYTRHLRSFIRDWEPDKILCTLWMPDALSSALAVSLLSNAPPIYTVVHGMEILDPKKGLKGWIRRRLRPLKFWAFAKSAHVFCVSRFSRDLVIKQTGLPPEKVTVVPNGVNSLKFEKNEKLPEAVHEFEHRYPILLTVARLVPHKGIDVTLRALSQITEDFPNCKYLIAGTGPDRRRLEELVDQLSLRRHVEFLGFVPDSDIADLYSTADLFVLLSRRDGVHVEGFGLVFLEAAVCGTPSLGGHSGGIPDAINDGETGWLTDPNDANGVAEKMRCILSAPADIEAMGEASQSFAKKHRTWDHVAQKISQTMKMTL